MGVAGVARLLAARGWQVSGCDAAPEGAMGAWLRAQGVAVAAGHDAGHIAAAGGPPSALLIHTAAVPADHPEMLLLISPGLDRNATIGFRCMKDAD